jgi:hypothetical protein
MGLMLVACMTRSSVSGILHADLPRPGGKARVVAMVKEVVSGPVVMLGDGATDMEARPPAVRPYARV